jgi:hypothetical protein
MQPESQGAPVVISFYCGDAYYHAAADRLRDDCARLDFDHDIVEIVKKPSETWVDICRRKVGFYLEMHRKHRRPIWWLDVDSRLSRRPAALETATCDMAGFLRGLRYLRGFEPSRLPRFFSPFALYFNQTPAATEFLELMVEIERSHEGAATDDYFLQEAWATHEQEMSVLILPPSIVGRQWPLEPHQSIYVGISGNVSSFKNQVQQHVAPAVTPMGRKTALMSEAAAAVGAGELSVAELLYGRALALGDRDDDLANKIARVIRRDGRLSDAVAFLQRYQSKHSPLDLARRFEIESNLDAGRLDNAGAACKGLLRASTPDDRRWAEIASLRIALEARAKASGLAAGDRPALVWDDASYIGYAGDLVPVYVVDRLSGVPPLLVSRTKGVLAGGASVRMVSGGHRVWGSGIASMADMPNPQADYRAVRGPLTRQRILGCGGMCPDIVGDPAWFLPRLHPVPRLGRGSSPALVLHPADEGLVGVEPGVRPVHARCNDYAGLETFILELHACSAVLTTSLTALIVCHAYGIPARWLNVQGRPGAGPVHDDALRDYLLSIGSQTHAPREITRGSRVDPALFDVDDQWLPARSINLRSLAAAAPFRISQDWRW